MGMMEGAGPNAADAGRAPRRLKDVLQVGMHAARLLSEEDAEAIEGAAYCACHDSAGPVFEFEELAVWPEEFSGYARVFRLKRATSDQVERVYFRGPAGQAVVLCLAGETSRNETNPTILERLGFNSEGRYLSIRLGELEGEYRVKPL